MKNTRLEELQDFDVELKKACFITDGFYLVDDEEVTWEGFITEDASVYEPNFLNQFTSEGVLDVERTNELCLKQNLNEFPSWSFNLTLAIYWDGSNWVCEPVMVDGVEVEGRYES